FLCGGHRQLALENLALRQQLAVYKRSVPRPRLRTMDRLLWVGLARVWAGWRQALVIVSPDTVLRWPRRRLREPWTKLSDRPIPCGARQESTASSSSSGSMSPSVRSLAYSRGLADPPRRPGG